MALGNDNAPKTRKSSDRPLGGNGNRRGPINWIWFVLLGLLIVQIGFYFSGTGPKEISYSELDGILRSGDVERVVIVNDEKARIFLTDDALQSNSEYQELPQEGAQYVTQIGSLEKIESTFQEVNDQLPDNQKMQLDFTTEPNYIGTILSWIIPLAIIIGLWVFILNRARRGPSIGGTNIFDFGKSKAKLVEKGGSDVTFDDVAGLDEVKVEVNEVVDFLKHPDKYTKLGAKIPKGVLLIGPPGTGKTLLARAVAGEAGVPFYNISGSEFVEMFVGVGASRVRDLFQKAKQSAPSIIFIDEIDAIGRSRGKAMSLQGNDERENTLNQMLTEMDGFGANTGVIVMAATNRGEILDRALLRPGRFDRRIYLDLPTRSERVKIFQVHTKDIVTSEVLDLELLAGQTPGFSGADIANVCNEAALIAARRNKRAVDMTDFADAIDRIVAGLEKKARVITDRERKIIAFHEAGHATASWYLEHADALLKVSIVPRGRSLGAAWYLPSENVINTEEQFIDRICATLAGRAAEEIVFNKISSGALDDLEKVTKQAYTMVAYYGLNERLGNISYYDSTGQYEQSFQKPYSEATGEVIDQEVQKLVERCYQRTKEILQAHRPQLDELAHLLLEKEMVMKSDLEKIFGKRPVESGLLNE